MNPGPLPTPTPPTWRDTISQDAPPRPRGGVARRRLVFASLRGWLAFAAIIACPIFGYIGWMAWRQNPAVLAAPVPAGPLRAIALRTDGVLTRAWVEHTLGLTPGHGRGLLSLDLPTLQARLLQTGQVKAAVLTRRFPDVLVVSLEERSPVLRVRARTRAGEESHLFVARDGFVFTGNDYDTRLIDSLPWLAGVDLTHSRTGPGFAPLEGLESVAALLGTVRSAAPTLAKDFQIISIGRFARDGVILVRTPEVAEIAFGTRDDFYGQIARLDYILEQLRARPIDAAPVRSINLAVGGRQVPVSLEPPPVPEPSAVPPSAPRRRTPSTHATAANVAAVAPRAHPKTSRVTVAAASSAPIPIFFRP